MRIATESETTHDGKTDAKASPAAPQGSPTPVKAAPRKSLPWQFWKTRNRVLIVGYSPRLAGGVVKVQDLLREYVPYVGLHVALYCYRPRWKSALSFVGGICAFVGRLFIAPPRVVQVIVGSSGDAVRSVPYILLARVRGCNVCLHFHKDMASILSGLPRPLVRCIHGTWRLAACDCYLSDRLCDEAARRQDSPKTRIVISNPISQGWLREVPLPRGARKGDVVFLGRWSQEKGIDELLSVMRTLDAGRPVRCDIYSDHSPAVGPENCVCHRWLPEEGVRQVLRDAKLLLLPSHSEAYPLVLLEAAACGTPFVASSIAGIPDIARRSGAGLLHGPGDVVGMGQAIERLLADDALWDDCSRSGRCWAESQEVSKIMPSWHRLYADLGIVSYD